MPLVSGIVGALLFYVATHGHYEDKHGRKDGQTKCWQAAAGFGLLVALCVWFFY